MGLILAIAASGLAASVAASADSAADVIFARQTSTQALTFREGDRHAFAGLDALFTPEGWTQFLTTLQDWRDPNGAPTFSSTFAPIADARVVDERDGFVHVRIPGTWTQTQKQSRSTYRIAVDVWVGTNPQRVHRLTETTCLGQSKNCD